MSKKTIALIIALFTTTVILIILAVFPVTQKTSISITPTPTVESEAETVLTLTPAVASTSAVASGSANYSMNVNILTGKNKVNAVQLELSYDSEALVNVDIKPGDFFTNPIVLLKNIDTETGRISYALAAPLGGDGKTGSGTVATLVFTPLGKNETTVKFLPKTQVAADGIQTSVLKSTVDTTILTAPSATITPTVSQ